MQTLICSSKRMRTPSHFLRFRAPEHRDGTTCHCVYTGMQSFAGVEFGHRFFSTPAPCQPTGHLSAVWGVPGSLQAIHSSNPHGAAGLAHAPALQGGEGTQNICKAFRMSQKLTCLGFCLGQVKLTGAFEILSESWNMSCKEGAGAGWSQAAQGSSCHEGSLRAVVASCSGTSGLWPGTTRSHTCVGVMGRSLPGGQWPCRAALGVSPAQDSCPQGQQSWEQGWVLGEGALPGAEGA